MNGVQPAQITYRKKIILITLSVALFLWVGPLFAWYYFISQSNGERLQWVFGSSCNTNARPITLTVDTSIPTGYKNTINVDANHIVTQWNNPFGQNINLLNSTLSSGASLSAAEVSAYVSSPTAGEIRIVYDSDSSLFSGLGLDPSTVLGVGLPLAMNPARPQDICAGIIILNGPLFGAFTTPANEFKKTLLHELGHVLGFAHSVSGGNGTAVSLVQMGSGTYSGDPSKLPVMFPFSLADASGNSGNPDLLSPDDKAAAIAVYGQ